jgi:serine/threonine protein kinase
MNQVFSNCCLGGNIEKETLQTTKPSIAPVPQVDTPGFYTPPLSPTIKFENGGFSKDDITFRGLVAKGAYASVYKICGFNEPENVACKYVCKICDCNEPNGFVGAFMREICILKYLSSPRLKKYNKNIVPLYDVIRDVSGANTIGLIMPRLKTSLHHYMTKYAKNIEVSRICFIITEILTGVNFIHENGIIHRDIKPANILIEGDVVQICDFNLAKSMDGQHKLGSHTEEVVTAPYRAPEVWRKQRYSYPIDIWSVGIILFEMIMGKFIYKMFDSDVNNTVVVKKLLYNYKLNRFYGILSQMLDFNQLTRITPANALKDPIFLNYKKTSTELIGIPRVPKVVEIIPPDLTLALKKFGARKEITKCLAGHILRVSRCSSNNAALMAIKMCEDDLNAHFELDSYKNVEFEILKNMRFNLVISGKSEYFADA